MDEEIRATCKILESVAKDYLQGSPERKAVKQAAEAFIYMRLHDGLRESYEAYQRSCAKPLSEAQVHFLKRLGVNAPDAGT